MGAGGFAEQCDHPECSPTSEDQYDAGWPSW